MATTRTRTPAFLAAADDAKANCPVSQALTGTTITLTAGFVSPT